VVALVVLLFLLSYLSSSSYRYVLTYELSTTSNATLLALLLLGSLIYGVLAIDELTVEHLVRDRFRRNTFRADAATTSGWERAARTLGLAPFRRELTRVAAAHRESAGRAEVVVHRGWVPFVGSGRLATDHTISLPLESADGVRTPQPFTAAELNTAVRAAMGELRSSASLSPGRRLARLEIHEQVFLPADQLTHLAGTPLAGVFTNRHRPPADWIPIEVARALANSPVEAGRYYVCARVEAWDRNLVSSCFLTSATDRRTLYLEWSNSVLFPLKARYRAIDRPADVAAGVRALLAALTLPATVPSRIANVLHYFSRIPERHDEVVADRHGAGRSIRELAAADNSTNFFQDADAVRYLKLVEQAMFRAVSEFLADRGYAIDDVMAQARARIAGNITINGGTFSNSAIGIGRTEQATTASGNTPTQPPAPGRTQ
jgi:hypothetical protein